MGIWTCHFWMHIAKHNQLQYLLHTLLPNMCQKQICHTCKICDGLVWKMNSYKYSAYEVTPTNHVTWNTVHIFDIYHWINMVTTLQYSSPSQLINLAYRLNIFVHIQQGTTNCNTYFKCDCQICARIKYAQQFIQCACMGGNANIFMTLLQSKFQQNVRYICILAYILAGMTL